MKTVRTLIFFVLTVIVFPVLFGQERDIRIEKRSTEEKPVEKPTGQKFAILVGVTEYEQANQFPTLTYTVTDVQAWQKELVKSFGFKPEKYNCYGFSGGPAKAT